MVTTAKPNLRPSRVWRVNEAILKGPNSMSLLLIVLLVLILFGGGGGYYAHRSYGGAGLGGVLGVVLIVFLVLFLFGGLHA